MGTILIATAYYPPLNYLAECLRAGEILIEACETYRKQTCRNHCRIYGPNGVQLLTVPVTKPRGNHTKTREVRISYELPWQRLHWRSLTTAYNKSPYFLYYQDHFFTFFEKKHEFLVDLNDEILSWILGLLRVDKPVGFTDTFERIPCGATDLRSALVSKHTGETGYFPVYAQPFSDRHGFIANLSFIDLLFNLGPDAGEYLESLAAGI
jgi:hypothetical protein